MARRQHITLSFILVLAVFFTLSYLFSGPSRVPALPKLDNEPLKEEARSELSTELDSLTPSFLTGESIAPKLENATIKYVLVPPVGLPFSGPLRLYLAPRFDLC